MDDYHIFGLDDHYVFGRGGWLYLGDAMTEDGIMLMACRFCFSEKGCWTWQCYHCGEIDDVQQPAPPQQKAEPLEYWNAVEGWVKIDEVREHFDSVGCGTIYKSSNEGRAPLYTTPPQRTWVGLTEEEIEQGCKESWVTEQAWQSAVWWAEAKLKEKNT